MRPRSRARVQALPGVRRYVAPFVSEGGALCRPRDTPLSCANPSPIESGRSRNALTVAEAAAAARAQRQAQARVWLLRTSCRSVAHIGDSTSVGLVSPDYLPDPAQRLAARYADVGVRHLRVDASGGRSIVEVLPGQVNGFNVAAGWRSAGYQGLLGPRAGHQ